ERITVNTGTVLGLALCVRLQRAWWGWVHPPPIGPGQGGAAVVLRAGESRRTWGRGAAGFREGKDTAMPKDASPNGDAPESWPGGSWTRVSEMQAKLHRW